LIGLRLRLAPDPGLVPRCLFTPISNLAFLHRRDGRACDAPYAFRNADRAAAQRRTIALVIGGRLARLFGSSAGPLIVRRHGDARPIANFPACKVRSPETGQ
jgi:hypothetical protein